MACAQFVCFFCGHHMFRCLVCLVRDGFFSFVSFSRVHAYIREWIRSRMYARMRACHAHAGTLGGPDPELRAVLATGKQRQQTSTDRSFLRACCSLALSSCSSLFSLCLWPRSPAPSRFRSLLQPIAYVFVHVCAFVCVRVCVSGVDSDARSGRAD
jgi:hypothetical protein